MSTKPRTEGAQNMARFTKDEADGDEAKAAFLQGSADNPK